MRQALLNVASFASASRLRPLITSHTMPAITKAMKTNSIGCPCRLVPYVELTNKNKGPRPGERHDPLWRQATIYGPKGEWG